MAEQGNDEPKSMKAVITVEIERYSTGPGIYFDGKMKLKADDVSAPELVEAALHILQAVLNSDAPFADSMVIQRLMEFGQENVAKGKFKVQNKNKKDVN